MTTLWPKTSHRSDLTVLDTYFNEKSEKCAKLAIGGVLDGIDKIMAGDWRNGFACVRPPGHHSGGRHTINGFCVYNNVAIGARYLLQRTLSSIIHRSQSAQSSNSRLGRPSWRWYTACFPKIAQHHAHLHPQVRSGNILPVQLVRRCEKPGLGSGLGFQD